MNDGRKRIAVNTGGGDAPGLNAVIRAVVLASVQRGWEVVGVEDGYGGLLPDEEGSLVPLDRESVRGLTHQGGTILGTTNRGNPFDWPVRGEEGEIVDRRDRSDEVIRAFRDEGLDALVAIGGDGSLHIAEELYRKGLPVVGVPKTIDNDVQGTRYTFGFITAVETATDAIGKLHSTAQSHERVMVVEVMGRHSGWIALYSGVAGTADVILIPEIPYDMESVCEKIRERERRGREFSIVCVAEGAHPLGGDVRTKEVPAGERRETRIGGIGDAVAGEIAERTGKDTRSLVLGHLQRGGQPSPSDRLLALGFGTAAIGCVEREDFGCMVGLGADGVVAVHLREALAGRKHVPLDHALIETARALGVCLGD